MAEPVIDQSPLQFVTLISSHREPVNITPTVTELNVYTDVFSSVMSGDVLVKDTYNIISEFGVSGTEFIYVKFKSKDNLEFEKTFRVYKVSEVKMLGLNVLTYKIHFVTEEFFLNQQIRVSKSYKGFYNHQIVADILINYLSVSPNKFWFEPTLLNEENLIVPNMKPLEAINMVSSFSINPTSSAAYLFYETLTGFNFHSLDFLFNQNIYKQIALRPENVINPDQQLTNTSAISNFEISQLFDSLQTVSTGGYSSSMIKMDLVGQKFESERFNPVAVPYKTLNQYLPFNDASNRNQNTLIDGSAFVRYFPKFQGDFVGKWLLQRASQFSLLNNYQLNIFLSGDSEFEAGSVVEISFPYFKPSNTTEEIQADLYKSGKYFVTSVRHRIVDGIYTNYVELCKDSNLSAYPSSADNDLTELYKRASSG